MYIYTGKHRTLLGIIVSIFLLSFIVNFSYFYQSSNIKFEAFVTQYCIYVALFVSSMFLIVDRNTPIHPRIVENATAFLAIKVVAGSSTAATFFSIFSNIGDISYSNFIRYSFILLLFLLFSQEIKAIMITSRKT